MARPRLSYVIPHKGRNSLLIKHLELLDHQSFDDYEVIVVLDQENDNSGQALLERVWATGVPTAVLFTGGKGPATARNTGAKEAKSDILLFTGSDCYPDKDLIARHYWDHKLGIQVVQGFTNWHHSCKSEFTDFLDATGLQGNFNGLKDDKGNYRRLIESNFCLTTNWSINKRLFDNIGGFDESFTGAAYEDIALGTTLARRGEPAFFNPQARNHHLHRYSLDSFLGRCRMEGQHRLTLCYAYPEFTHSLINSDMLAMADSSDLVERLRWAKELDLVRDRGDEQSNALKRARWERWLQVCQIASFKGVDESLKRAHPILRGLRYTKDQMSATIVMLAAKAIKTEHWAYSQHCAEWLSVSYSDSFYSWATAGEIHLALDDKERAIQCFKKALEIDANNGWSKERMGEFFV